MEGVPEMKSFGLASVILAIATQAQAETIDPRLAKWNTCGTQHVFHTNGISTTFVGAVRSLEAIESAYGNAHDGRLLAYRLAYNPTQGALLDLWEAANQKAREYPGVTFVMIIRALLGLSSPNMPRPLSDDLRRLMTDRIKNTGYVSSNDADLQQVTNSLRAQFIVGGKLVWVAHSQGSLYANAAYAVLTSTGPRPIPVKSIGIVAVATPAAFVAGANGRYVNSSNDLVVQGVRLLPNGGVLTPNVTQPMSLDDWSGHSFIKTYLRAQTDGRTKLLSDIRDQLNTLRGDVTDPRHTYVMQVSSNYWPPLRADELNKCAPEPSHVKWRVGYSDPPNATDFNTRGGSPAEAAAIARSSVEACLAKAIPLARERQLNPLLARSVRMSCGGYGFAFGAPDDINTAWAVHSADGYSVSVISRELDMPMYYSVGLCFGLGASKKKEGEASTHTAFLRPVCNR